MSVYINGVEQLVSHAIIFTKVGELEVGVNATLAIVAPRAFEVEHVRCYAKTAPAGADIIVDINKNGTTIFTTQGNRPTIGDGLNKGGKSATPDVVSIADGDVMTLDIDQIGSGTPGSDLTVYVRCKE